MTFLIKDSPPPGQYQIPSEFKQTKSKGYTFGLSRISVAKRYLHSQPPPDKVIPGPGTYKHKEVVGKDSYRYSMKTKFKVPEFDNRAKLPGPGRYDYSPSLNSKGKHFISQFKDSGSKTFDPTSSQRFFPISHFKKSNLLDQDHIILI